ncbi:FMN-binding protein [Coprococcus comes]|uniref:FMN-binding protein n=1 Tax=Coprococcus comes TaxID=410072 RepID=UPI0018986C8C|nr:FMN-binding protein [Coprococcus comes]
MREFWVRLVSMLAIVGVLLGYNSVLDARAKEDEIAQLSAQVAGNGQSDSENRDSTNYKDGTYTGEADGFGGTIQVEVKIEKNKIAEINVVSAEKEDGAYLSMAKDIIPKIIDAQSADIDTISGATFSSTGIKNASEQALEKAVK